MSTFIPYLYQEADVEGDGNINYKKYYLLMDTGKTLRNNGLLSNWDPRSALLKMILITSI